MNDSASQNDYFIGLSVTYHDPAVAIVDSSRKLLFAEATERHLQLKRALNCEPDSLYRIVDLLGEYCLGAERLFIARNWRRKRPFYEYFCQAARYFTPQGLLRSRFGKRSTFLEKYKLFHMLACQRQAMSSGGINLSRMLRETFPSTQLHFMDFDHHLTHAAFACYGSPFEEADCFVADSYGERGSLAFYRYRNGEVELCQEFGGIESLGFFYMKLTELCGFDWIKGEEWKVMGLASYGVFDQRIYDLFRLMIGVEGLRLTQDLANIRTGMDTLEREYAGCHPMDAADLAHTGQHFFSELMLALVNNLHSRSLSKNLVVCGGCALNSAFNGQILQRTGYQRLYIPPAPADDGTAVGAAVLACDKVFPGSRKTDDQPMNPYLGSEASADTLARVIRYSRGMEVRHLPAGCHMEAARLLSEGKLIGWMQGRAEFGPRALGNRSILADPRRKDMKEKINGSVKFREEFRPFAPSILDEFGDQYFENYEFTPYMERTLRFRPEMRDRVPAVVHVDGTGRLQTVRKDWNKRFHDLLTEFNKLTGVPVLLNTSFNVMGKPIVHSVEDAVSVFLTTGLDALVIGDFLIEKPD